MKKIVFVVLGFLLCLPLAVYAIGTGDPTTNGQGKFSIGVDNDYVFNRDMKLKSLSAPVDENGNGNGNGNGINGVPACEIKKCTARC